MITLLFNCYLALLFVGSLMVIWVFISHTTRALLFLSVPLACINELVLLLGGPTWLTLLLYCINILLISSVLTKVYSKQKALILLGLIAGCLLCICLMHLLYATSIAFAILPLGIVLLALVYKKIKTKMLYVSGLNRLAVHYCFAVCTINLLFYATTFLALPSNYSLWALAIYLLYNCCLLLVLIYFLFIYFNHNKKTYVPYK